MKLKTVKEIAARTGISVRTLHYYDEIGLLKPSEISESGYRLYDEKALETLQQILFFRELDTPLKEIKAILENPGMDKNEILEGQKRILELKRKRLDRLIDNISDMLKGGKIMDFQAFQMEDVEEIFELFVKNAPENVLQEALKEFGSMDAFRENYVKKAYENYNRPEVGGLLMEMYGDKETLMEATRNPLGMEGITGYQEQFDQIMRRLADRKREGFGADSPEVQALICQYALVMKEMLRIKSERTVMLGIADTNTDARYPQVGAALEEQYGEEGIAEYFAEGIRIFYR